jgi:outer membrane immunogenic protein
METFGMRSVLFCVAALVTCSVPAAAADMLARPAPVIAAAPLYNWGGFYGGINAGGHGVRRTGNITSFLP